LFAIAPATILMLQLAMAPEEISASPRTRIFAMLLAALGSVIWLGNELLACGWRPTKPPR
jgi:hypothetical protein